MGKETKNFNNCVLSGIKQETGLTASIGEASSYTQDYNVGTNLTLSELYNGKRNSATTLTVQKYYDSNGAAVNGLDVTTRQKNVLLDEKLTSSGGMSSFNQWADAGSISDPTAKSIHKKVETVAATCAVRFPYMYNY